MPSSSTSSTPSHTGISSSDTGNSSSSRPEDGDDLAMDQYSSVQVEASGSSAASLMLSDDELDAAPTDPAHHVEYKVYALRWLVLFTFALLTITNALLWICMARQSNRTATSSTGPHNHCFIVC